jgi:endonuclease-3
MNKNARKEFISKTLEQIYPETPIPLNHKNNFELLIAVLLSAQCTDERVNKITPKLFAQAKGPFQMINIPLDIIYNIVRPCGLGPQKSKAISKLSSILVKEHDGKVPNSFKELEKLPGVGHKTASVVMSQGYGYPAFPVDTHIHRLAQRWKLTNGKNVTQTEKDLKRLFPKDCWNRLHLQIIYYGREFCTARSCFGLTCKICKSCFPNRIKPVITKK